MKIYGKLSGDKVKTQLQTIEGSKIFNTNKIAIMPDNHFGKGAPIGFTVKYDDKIVPNLVGVDVGCGVTGYKLDKIITDYSKLTETIRKNVPHGMNIHNNEQEINISIVKNGKTINFNRDNFITKFNDKQWTRVMKSMGSLGGGNHFIELNEDSEGNQWLIVHSGSRSLGAIVAKYHQDIAKKESQKKTYKLTKEEINKIEPRLRAEFIKNFKSKNIPIPQDLEYLTGKQIDDYINDMELAQLFANQNRESMLNNILKDLNINKTDSINSIHNYIDIEHKIIRKGAISAQEGEKVLIPLNMRDGVIIGIGKGTKESNYSAPHGAGRIMSRTVAKETLNLKDYKDTMENVYSDTININTLDEAPFAYKPKDEIIEGIKELVEIKEVLKTIYNFKDDSETIDYTKLRKAKKEIK